MTNFTLTSAFGANKEFSCPKKFSNKDFDQHLERVMQYNHPDFAAVLNPYENYTKLVEKKIVQNFQKQNNSSMGDLFDQVSTSQYENILKIDSECVEFVKRQKETDLINLCFCLMINTNFQKENNRVLLRKMEFVNVKQNNTTVLLPLVCLTDVTDFTLIKKNLSFSIRHSINSMLCFYHKTQKFKKNIEKIINRETNLTARELEILKLIALGKTSKEIAEALYISIATVSTHRQNLIKKFKVTNTASLIKLL